MMYHQNKLVFLLNHWEKSRVPKMVLAKEQDLSPPLMVLLMAPMKNIVEYFVGHIHRLMTMMKKPLLS